VNQSSSVPFVFAKQLIQGWRFSWNVVIQSGIRHGRLQSLGVHPYDFGVKVV
jgi:hypothetical protein